MKINNFVIVCLLLLTISCKNNSDTEPIAKKYIVSALDNSTLFKEINNIKKTSDYNFANEIQKLDIAYNTLNIQLRYLSEKAYISIKNGDNLLLDWESVKINFFYDSSLEIAEKDIHLLLNQNNNRELYLLFPSFTEEYKSYFVYFIKPNFIQYIGNFECSNFNKGSFEFDRKNQELYIKSDKKYTLKKLEDSQSKNELPLEEIKKDIERIKDSSSEINSLNNWIGNYDCNFLRMKEESADPRAYGMIYINIDNNEAKFKLDTYVEIIDKDLIVLSCNSTEIILAERDNQKSKFTITKNNKKYELKSDLLNNTVGEISTYGLIKK